MPVTLLRLLVAMVAACAPALLPAPARADGLSSCTFAMSRVAFGDVDVLPGGAIPTNATLSVRCPTLGTVIGSTLYACVAFPTPRRMTGPSATLAYDFYGPSPGTGPWSSTTPVQIPLSLLQNGGTATVAVQAAIGASQSATPPGAYTTAGTATVSFGLLLGCPITVYSTTFPVTVDASVTARCNVSARDIAFGTTGLLLAALTAEGQVQAQCTAGTAYQIALDNGTSGATDPSARRMRLADGSAGITYGLFRNSARTQPWGSTAGSDVASGTGTAASLSYPVYALVPAQPTPKPGSYSDTVVVSVTY